MVGKQGLEPVCLLPGKALPAAPPPVTSGPPESNRVSPESESGRLPSSSIPIAHVETPGIEPGRRCLQGMPATSASRPHSRRSDATAASGRRHLPLWCSRYGRVNLQAHSPSGGAPQGRQELNPHSPVLETGCLSAGSSPWKRKPPRASLGAVARIWPAGLT